MVVRASCLDGGLALLSCAIMMNWEREANDGGKVLPGDWTLGNGERMGHVYAAKAILLHFSISSFLSPSPGGMGTYPPQHLLYFAGKERVSHLSLHSRFLYIERQDWSKGWP